MSPSIQSLFPGYKQVASFGPDDEYELEQEVSYVTLDLGSIEPTLIPSSSTYRLIGLDTPTPFLQLSGTILKGEHDSLLGSELLFSDGKDDADRNKKSIAHVATTEQRIRFREVQLKPKTHDAQKQDGNANIDPGYEQTDYMAVDVVEESGGGEKVKGKGKAKEKVSKGKSTGKGKNKPKGKRKGKEQDVTHGDQVGIEMEGSVGLVYPADAMNVDEG